MRLPLLLPLLLLAACAAEPRPALAPGAVPRDARGESILTPAVRDNPPPSRADCQHRKHCPSL